MAQIMGKQKKNKDKKLVIYTIFLASAILFQEFLSTVQQVLIQFCLGRPDRQIEMQAIWIYTAFYRFIIWPIIDFLTAMSMLYLFYSL
jgi:hypothetical protein